MSGVIMNAQFPFAFATYLIRDDSYLPGALVQAYALRRQSEADLVCLVGEGVSSSAVRLADTVFDSVHPVSDIVVPNGDARKRPYLPLVFTKLHALRLGIDGDLGAAYRRVVVLDADILPVRCFDHLFAVQAPGGILNERRELLKGRRHGVDSAAGRRPGDRPDRARWEWHRTYRFFPHGQRIPADVTDRVRRDRSNYGVNTALLVLEPDMGEFRAIRAELTENTDTIGWCKTLPWPDMQYLTARWSGRWRNIDACFAGLDCYPSLDVLFGCHFAGLKPWQLRKEAVTGRYARYADFGLWYELFLEMMTAVPELAEDERMATMRRTVLLLGTRPAARSAARRAPVSSSQSASCGNTS